MPEVDRLLQPVSGLMEIHPKGIVITQPRVARSELPWVGVEQEVPNPEMG